jgi:hypothetical protein
MHISLQHKTGCTNGFVLSDYGVAKVNFVSDILAGAQGRNSAEYHCIMVSGELLLLLLHGLGPLIQQGGGLLAHGRCDGRLLALLGEASATATSPPWTASMG